MILWLFILSSTLWAKELSVLTLNLHGQHPMGEERRLLIHQDGKKEIAWSHLFYFTPIEIQRGSNRRNEVLSGHLDEARPQLIFLQEVGAPVVSQTEACRDFQLKNTAENLRKK